MSLTLRSSSPLLASIQLAQIIVMALTTCIFCRSYINVPAVQAEQRFPCPACRKELLLYKCFSCMQVSAFNPAARPGSCPRCHTVLRGIAGPPPERGDVFIHNDNPLKVDYASWRALDLLVFRGSGVAYSDLNAAGFLAAADQRFPMPTIIRDKWLSRQVTTHMQTKNVLAWSKSFSKATEYAAGQIKGAFGKVTPGHLYFAHVQRGVDVTSEVRDFERKNALPPIAEGTQKEVLTPTLPKSRVLATWEVVKGRAFGNIQVQKKNTYDGEFPDQVMKKYQLIDKEIPLNTEFDFYEAGGKVDKLLAV